MVFDRNPKPPIPYTSNTGETNMGQYLGEEIPKLGFGMMRLPKNGETIDIETTKVMVDKFLAAGFTYFDTAWIYQGTSTSSDFSPKRVIHLCHNVLTSSSAFR